MSDAPQPPFRSAQHEFTDEQNRTIGGLADAMGTAAALLQLLGLAFVVLVGLQVTVAVQTNTGWGPAAGLGAAALLSLAVGFWTSAAAGSFRRVVESRNEDVWHLMNALRKLHGMYSLLRTLVLGSLLLAVVGLAVVGFGLFAKPGPGVP